MRSRWQLLSTTFDTGDAEDDAETARLVRLALGGDSGVYDACPLPFDEGRMWQGEGSAMRREQLMNNLRNVSAIMDCVGCEKCRLWGKLQVLGIASSMKVLSATEGEPTPVLARNEIVALVNSLARFSEAIRSVAEMDDALAKREAERRRKIDMVAANNTEEKAEEEEEEEEEEEGGGDIVEPGSVDEL